MSRVVLDELMQQMADDPVLRPALAFEGEYTSGTVNLWSGVGPLSWDGKTWQGVAGLYGVSSMVEDADIRAGNVSLSLSGIDQDTLDQALNEFFTGAPRKLWLLLLDQNGEVKASTLAVAGRADVAAIDEGDTDSKVTETVESVLVDLNRSRERRYTHEDQQLTYPGDKGFLQVPTIQDWAGTWGAMPVGGGSTGGGAGGGGDACFSGNVKVQTPEGWINFSELPGECVIVNQTGTHRATLLLHNFSGPMLDLGEGRLVTLNHPLRCGEFWLPAELKYPKRPRVQFSGKVYNLQVQSENEADRHYLLDNGDVAHNKTAPRDNNIE